jgi:hypothetical protein
MVPWVNFDMAVLFHELGRLLCSCEATRIIATTSENNDNNGSTMALKVGAMVYSCKRYGYRRPAIDIATMTGDTGFPALLKP